MNTFNDEMNIKNEEPQILTLRKFQIPAAAKMMADTFFHDPLACYLIPNESDRLEILENIWSKAIKYDFPLGYVYCSHYKSSNTAASLTNSQLLGIASWLPPKAKPTPLLQSLPLILRVFLKSGWIPTSRILTSFAKTEAYRLHDCPTPHWYLDGLAVSPNTQGKGIGGLLLQPVLKQADRQGEICYLFTSTPRAVKFYQRHGFVIRDELQILGDAPALWMMMRSPQA